MRRAFTILNYVVDVHGETISRSSACYNSTNCEYILIVLTVSTY